MDSVVLDQKKISAILPQAYPFIMIDRVTEFKKDEYLTAVKNITGSEWIFEGQSYKTDIFPETLIIEAASQAALMFYYLNDDSVEEQGLSKVRLGGIKSEFLNPVSIGDQLQITTGNFKMLKDRGYIHVSIFKDNDEISKIKVFYGLAN